LTWTSSPRADSNESAQPDFPHSLQEFRTEIRTLKRCSFSGAQREWQREAIQRYCRQLQRQAQHNFEVVRTSEYDPMQFQYDDGGRAAAGYKGTAADCVCRAIAIAAQLPYRQVYAVLSKGNATEPRTKYGRKSAGRRSARNGINAHRQWFYDYMESLGFRWVPSMKTGEGRKIHLRDDELPAGRLVVALSRHMAAVIDGVLHDTHQCDRGGTRRVHGYYINVTVGSDTTNFASGPNRSPV
jgi:hypothetical protein